MLLGRSRETATLSEHLQRARDGSGGALVVRGEAGVGKSSLLEWTVRRADGFRVLRAAGAEFEMELAFAGLHALCAPLLGRRDLLPEPQLHALETAFALREGSSSDPLKVGLAVLTMLSDAAEEAPILCVIDDAHWLDRSSARAVAFAARRIENDRVAVLLASRTRPPCPELDALPELGVARLADDDARDLLLSTLYGPVDERVIGRILAEARGNPLVLHELASTRSQATSYPGSFVIGVREPTAEPLFRSRVDSLPPATRRLLVTAAADPTGDPLLLWRAAGHLELSPGDATPAEEAGLLTVDQRVRFTHPLARSAVYRMAPAAERRRAHAALAAATDVAVDPDRRAWHRAQAASGPDAEVADELVRSAERAQLRGGVAAAAAVLERAAALTPTPHERAERTLRAAELMMQAGALVEAQALVAAMDRAAMPDLLAARTSMLAGVIAYGTRRGSDAPALFRGAAQRLERLDARAARDAHVSALLAGIAAGSMGSGVTDVAAAALAAPPAVEPLTDVDDVLDGMALVMSGRRLAGTGRLRRALADHAGSVWEGRPTLACLVAVELWDLAAYESILTNEVARLRATGAITLLPQALSPLAGALLPAGRFRAAEALLVESDDLAEAIGVAPLQYSNMHLAALRGHAELTSRLVDDAMADATDRGEGLLAAFAQVALALLCNGRADYAGALAAAGRAVSPLEFSFEGMRARELVEAAVHCGEHELSRVAFDSLRERTRLTETPWGRGTEETCAALLAKGPAVEEHFRCALEQLSAGDVVTDLGRTELLYGEWLRRQGRRVDAREQLRRAFDRLSTIGAHGFAERARVELAATGERTYQRNASNVDDLTPQEFHVADLVGRGATSKEVAAELFLSPRTVDAHLRSIFRKLDITSRRQLRNHALVNR